MLWLPWATHRKVWHKMAVWTATQRGWPSKLPFCAILFYASPRATKACETRLLRTAANYQFYRILCVSSPVFQVRCGKKKKKVRRRSGQSVTASDFGSNGPRFESGRGRCVESLDKALYSHCPKEKPSH